MMTIHKVIAAIYIVGSLLFLRVQGVAKPSERITQNATAPTVTYTENQKISIIGRLKIEDYYRATPGTGTPSLTIYRLYFSNDYVGPVLILSSDQVLSKTLNGKWVVVEGTVHSFEEDILRAIKVETIRETIRPTPTKSPFTVVAIGYLNIIWIEPSPNVTLSPDFESMVYTLSDLEGNRLFLQIPHFQRGRLQTLLNKWVIIRGALTVVNKKSPQARLIVLDIQETVRPTNTPTIDPKN
jgi:hypothetical protein